MFQVMAPYILGVNLKRLLLTFFLEQFFNLYDSGYSEHPRGTGWAIYFLMGLFMVCVRPQSAISEHQLKQPPVCSAALSLKPTSLHHTFPIAPSR